VGKELSSSSNSSYAMTYSLQKYTLNCIISLPGGMATCKATNGEETLRKNSFIYSLHMHSFAYF
jgi:hypothetical protein